MWLCGLVGAELSVNGVTTAERKDLQNLSFKHQSLEDLLSAAVMFCMGWETLSITAYIFAVIHRSLLVYITINGLDSWSSSLPLPAQSPGHQPRGDNADLSSIIMCNVRCLPNKMDNKMELSALTFQQPVTQTNHTIQIFIYLKIAFIKEVCNTNYLFTIMANWISTLSIW